ncbi:MAG: excalibur calcium-binding domain-containing protein [Ferribacterium limneticum]
MKKILFIAVIIFGAWQFYHEKNTHSLLGKDIQIEEPRKIGKNQQSDLPPSRLSQSEQPGDTAQITPAPPQQFACDGRQHCSQMTSRAEAEFFTKNCPGTKMDGDHDGIPCENDSRF